MAILKKSQGKLPREGAVQAGMGRKGRKTRVERAGIRCVVFSRTLWPVGKGMGWGVQVCPCSLLWASFSALVPRIWEFSRCLSWDLIPLLLSVPFFKPKRDPPPLLCEDAPGVLFWPHSIAKSTRARGGRGWEGREHLCLIHLLPILQVRKLRPLAHSCTTSKSPEFLYAFSVPRGTAQWPPKARSTEALPAGSFVRALPAVFRRTPIQADHLRALAPKQWAYSVTFVSQ